jgi:anti-sigma factor RsiW
MSVPEQSKFTQAELADISALADGSLEPARRAAVQRRIDGDPEMRQLFEREQRAAQMLATARARDRASSDLRARIEADREAYARSHRRRSPLGWAAAAGVAIAAAAAVLVLVLGTSQTPASPSVSEAAALALRGASMPAPAPNPSSPRTQLSVAVGSLHFPNYAVDLSTSAVGQRNDQLASRRVVTVYYSRGHRRIAYSIVSGRPLAVPAGQTPMRGFVALRLGQRTILTWRRDGHTCVLSATGVPVSELLEIASWTPSTPAAWET